MPEGDTIYTAARTLRRHLVGRVVEEAVGSDHFRLDASRLVGRTTREVESRGKHLLVHLDDGHVIHSHMGMTGSWHVYAAGATWRKPRRNARLVLRVEGQEVVCFTPKQLELLTPDGLRRHAHLQRLGPDVLDESFDVEACLARLRREGRRPVGEVVMDQRVLAGIGNVYKSEVLFLERIDPFAPVASLDDERLRGLLRRTVRLARRNLEGKPRRTRSRPDGRRKWVYGRSGEPCYECGTSIRMRRQGDLGRSTYWCPACQPSHDEAAVSP